jgi:hypothetical protein
MRTMTWWSVLLRDLIVPSCRNLSAAISARGLNASIARRRIIKRRLHTLFKFGRPEIGVADAQPRAEVRIDPSGDLGRERLALIEAGLEPHNVHDDHVADLNRRSS